MYFDPALNVCEILTRYAANTVTASPYLSDGGVSMQFVFR